MTTFFGHTAIEANADLDALLGGVPLGRVSGLTLRSYLSNNATVNVRDYGATGNGVTDDTAAFLLAVAALTTGGVLWVPRGKYLITDTVTIALSGIQLIGEGDLYTLGSSILFNPTVTKPCFLFQRASAAAPLFSCGMHNIVGASTNSVQKTFIRAVDVSEFTLSRVRTDGSWIGNGSVGFEVQGREFVRTYTCTFFGDRPLIFSRNPRHAFIDIDTFSFRDTYLGPQSATYYSIELGQTGVSGGEIRELRNLMFDGLFMVGGKGGLRWVATNPDGDAQDCLGLIIRNGGIEQTGDPNGYFLDVERPAGTLLYNTELRQIQPASSGQHGIKLRRTSHTKIEQLQWPDVSGTRKVLDIDATCRRTSWRNLWTQPGSGSTIVGQFYTWSGGLVSADYALPPNADLDAAAPTFMTEGDLLLSRVGTGIHLKEGVNATMGVATLVAGTVLVSTTKVTATSRVVLARQSKNGGTMGHLEVSSVNPGTAFQITSSSATDTSIVAWTIIEPA